MAALIAVAIVIVLIGAALFSITQHDSYPLSLYWAITTATTVGYGDVLPHNTVGRVIASLVMLTTIPIVGAVFSLVAGATAASHLRRILGMDTHLPHEPYIVIFGTHPVIPRVLEELDDGRDERVVLVTQTAPPVKAENVTVIVGDPTDERVLAKSRPAEATMALIACHTDADTLVVAVALHDLAPETKVYALAQSSKVAAALRELGVTHTIAALELLGHTVAKSLETPQAGDLLLQMVEATGYRLGERVVEAAQASQPLSAIRCAPGSLVLGIVREDEKIDLGVGDDPTLSAGDRLIVLDVAGAA